MKIRSLASAMLCGLLLSSPAFALFEDKFAAETVKEFDAVKLARDTQAGGYALITAAELKKMIDEGKPVLLVDTMPFEESFKKSHIPGARNFLFPVSGIRNDFLGYETDGWKNRSRFCCATGYG